MRVASSRDLLEKPLEHVHDELHRRVVVVQHQHLVHGGLAGFRPRLDHHAGVRPFAAAVRAAVIAAAAPRARQASRLHPVPPVPAHRSRPSIFRQRPAPPLRRCIRPVPPAACSVTTVPVRSPASGHVRRTARPDHRPQRVGQISESTRGEGRRVPATRHCCTAPGGAPPPPAVHTRRPGRGDSRACLHVPPGGRRRSRRDQCRRSGSAAELLDRERHAGGQRRQGLLGQLHRRRRSACWSRPPPSPPRRGPGWSAGPPLPSATSRRPAPSRWRAVSSICACAVAAKLLDRSCTPAAQIWPAFTNASTLPWPKDTNSSARLDCRLVMFVFSCAWIFSDRPAGRLSSRGSHVLCRHRQCTGSATLSHRLSHRLGHCRRRLADLPRHRAPLP